jgi:hypothetical protein
MPGTLLMSVIVIIGAGLSALGALAWLRLGGYRRVQRRVRVDEKYSPERYQPLARLLGGEDVHFLRRNIRCPKAAARWDRSQRRIVRLYLKELAADFHCLHSKARIIVAESPEQYSALIPVLFRQQLTFWKTLATIELRLTLGGLHVTAASVEELVQAIDAIQRELARVSTPSAA